MKYNLFVKGGHVAVAQVTAEVLPRVGDIVSLDHGYSNWFRVLDVRHHVIAQKNHLLPTLADASTYSIGVHTEPYHLSDLRKAMTHANPAVCQAMQAALCDESLEGVQSELMEGKFAPAEVDRVYDALKERLKKDGLTL